MDTIDPAQRQRLADYEKRKQGKIAARRRELYAQQQQERTRRPVAARTAARRPMSSQVATEPHGAPCPHYRSKWLAEINQHVANGMTHSAAAAVVAKERPALVSMVRIEARRLRGRMTPQQEYTELMTMYQTRGGLSQREAAERIRRDHPDLTEAMRAGSSR